MKTRTVRNLFYPSLLAALAGISHGQIPTDHLTLWLKADAGVVKDANNRVSTWQDQSPRSNHLTQANGSYQPLWTNQALSGLPVLEFRDDWLVRSAVWGTNLFSANAATAFIVQKQMRSDPRTTTLAWRTGSEQRLYIHATYDDTIAFQVGHPTVGGGVGVAQPPNWDDAWHVLSCWRETTNGQIRVDGVAVSPLLAFTANADPNQPADLVVASDHFGNTFNGDIAEIILYSRALSEAERFSVESYLFTKWSVPTAPAAIPDLLIKKAGDPEGAYAADDVFQPEPAASQIVTQSVAALATTAFNVRAQNDGQQSEPILLKATESAGSGWTVAYKIGASNITAQIVSTSGFTTASLPPGGSVVVTVEISMTGVALPGATKSVTVRAYDDYLPALVRDAVQAVAVAAPGVQPDLLVRREIDPTPMGENIYNADGAGQTSWQDVRTNQAATYYVTWANDGNTNLLARVNGSSGDTGWTVSYYDHVLRFDGADDYVDLGAWAPGVRWTVEAWVKLLAVPDMRRRTIAGAAAGGVDWGITLQNGQLGVLTKPVDGSSTITYLAGAAPETNVWYHVVGTCDGTNAWLYIDGVPKTNGLVYPDYPGYSGGTRIGGEACCGGNNFPGLIREVRIWNRPLNSGEVQAVFAQPPSANAVGLIGYWPLSEGAGSTVRDLSASQRQGTLVSGPLWTRRDLTAAIAGPGWTNNALGPGRSVELVVEVTPNASVPGGAIKEVLLTATAVGDPTKLDAVKMVTTAIQPSTTPVGALYTATADFGKGWMSGVDNWTVPNQLQLSRVAGVLPFLWVPNSGDGTVSKVDTRTGNELGRYRVSPPSVAGNPSRTTVDLRGNCWVANRACSTAVKIGLLEHGEGSDRNGDGIIQTSQDLNGDGNITGSELLDWGMDECVLHEVVLTPGHETNHVPGQYLGSYVNNYWNPGLRGMAVDAQGTLWAGTHDTMKYFHIDGVTGRILRSIDVSPSNHTAYGAVIDANGSLWSSGYKESGQQNLLRLNTADGSFSTIVLDFHSYGMALDRNNHLFVSAHQEALLTRWNTLTSTREWTVSVGGYNRGVAVTDDGDVWVVSSGQGTVTRFSNDGVKKATIAVGPTPTGVAVDAAGKVWVMGTGDEYLRRIDPATDAVDLTKWLASSHYGYSDMTGAIVRNSTVRLGLWSAVHDGQIPNTAWDKVVWHGSDPTGTNILVRVRSSNNRAAWSAWESAVNGVPLLATPPGRYLEFEVTLRSLPGIAEPVLYDVAATGLAPGEADLGLLLGASPHPVLSEYPQDYAVTVINLSTNWAAGVLVTNIISTNFDLVSINVPGGSYQRTDNTVICALAGVAPNSTATITFATFPLSPGVFTNSATVVADTPDPNLANNSNRFVLTIQPVRCTDPSPGIVGWWPGESNAWSLAGTNHGTLQGTVGFVPAKVGRGFTFDGNDDLITIAHAPELNPSRSGFSAQFWMKGGKNQAGQGSSLCALLEKSHGWTDYTGWAFQTWPASGLINFNIGNGLDGTWPNVSSIVDVLDARWHHVAATWDGFAIRLFVDGVLQGSYPLLRPGLNTRNLNIGFAWGGGSPQRFFRGQVDEVMIHNRVLSQAEIAAIYNARSGGVCRALLISQPAEVADAAVGAYYTQQFSTIGTPWPVLYSHVRWNLPSGLLLSSSGLLSGTPSSEGTYVFTVQAEDFHGGITERTFTNNVFACAPPPSGLVGWWRAENNTDDFAGVNHGTLEYQASYDLGPVGRAFLLDGNDDAVRLFGSSSGALDITTNQLTIDAWINVAATNPPATEYQMIVDKAWDGQPNGYELAVIRGELRLWLATTSVPQGFALTNVNALPFQRWVHVAGTYDGAMARLYVDGGEVAAVPLTGNLLHNNHDACIGNDNWPGSRGYAFNGLIDEVQIFNRGLSGAEIAAIHRAGPAGTCVPMPADLLVKNSGEPDSAYALNDQYQSPPAGGQTKLQAVSPLQTAAYHVKIENDAPAACAFVLRATENPPAHWTTVYKLSAVEVTAILHSSTGLPTTVLAPGASQVLTVEVTPSLRVYGGTWQSAVVSVYADSRSATVLDSIQALTQCVPTYQPDLMIRRENDVNFLGQDIINITGVGQTKQVEIEAGDTAPYRVQLRNSGNVTNRFALLGSGGGSGWTVGYCGDRPMLQMDGTDDYVSIPNAPALHSDRQLTVSGWFKTDGLTKQWQNIFWKGNTPDCTANCENREYALWLNSAGYLWLTSTPSNRIGLGELNLGTAAGLIQANRWYHFAAVLNSDSNYMRIFVNGELKASGPYSTNSIRTTSGPLLIGTQLPLAGNNLWGAVQDLALWPRALDSNELASLVTQLRPCNNLGLAGCWPLRDGFNVATDYSASANHGQLVNGPTWSLSRLNPSGCFDITAAMTGAGWSDPVLAPGATYEFTIEVTPDGGVPGGTMKEILVTAHSLGAASPSDTVKAVTAVSTTSTVPVGGTYTASDDFANNHQEVGVDYTSVPDQLQLSAAAVTLPFIWVPNSEGTISKVDTRDGRELARYRTGPPNVNSQPSRTTVDLQGNCWVANRYSGTAVKVGLLENGQFIDRNGNGQADTSRDINGDGDITGGELLDWGQDECVLFEVSLIPGAEGTFVPGTFTGPYQNSWGYPGPRGVAVDAEGNCWIGTYDTKKFYHVGGTDGQILRTIDVSSVNHTSYGAVMDGHGIVWSSGSDKWHILRLDPAAGTFTTHALPHHSYGINVDRNNHLFVSGWQNTRLTRLNTVTAGVEWTVSGIYESRGIAITDDGDVWIANSGPGTVARWSNDGVLKAAIPAGNQPTGVAVDHAGKVWALGLGDPYIRRIDPATDSVDLTKQILCGNNNGYHYGYSDMTGNVARNTTTRIGTWIVRHNAKVLNTPWGLVSWLSDEPAGTSLRVRVRSSNNQQTWSVWESVANGTALHATPPGKYLEVEVTLQSGGADVTPTLYDLTIIPALEANYGSLIYLNDFEGVIDSEWSNTRVSQTSTGLRRFLGGFGNQTVTLALSNLPPHIAATVVFDQFVLGTWDGNNTNDGPDLWELNVAGGLKLLRSTFNNGPASSLADGQAYPGIYPGAIHPTLNGAAETNTLGFIVAGVGTMDSVYRHLYSFPHTADSLVLNFVGSGLASSPAEESWGLDNVRVYLLTQTGPPELRAVGLDPSGFVLDLLAGAGWSYVIQSSSNLVEWSALSTNRLGTNRVRLVDPAAIEQRQLFYRALRTNY